MTPYCYGRKKKVSTTADILQRAAVDIEMVRVRDRVSQTACKSNCMYMYPEQCNSTMEDGRHLIVLKRHHFSALILHYFTAPLDTMHNLPYLREIPS